MTRRRTTTHPATARTRLGARIVALLTAVGVALGVPAAPGSAATPRAVSPAPRVPLPAAMADTGGGTQLLTARARTTGATTGTVRWWQRHKGRWRQVGSAPARFGAGGLAEGGSRVQGTATTPTGLYDLPFGFGTAPAPPGTTTPYRRVRAASWWCEDNASASYNRWVEPLPPDCAAGESERLAGYPTQYSRALVIGFNYHRPARGRGAGIFLHVHGKGATAGCVSVPAGAMARILSWVRPSAHPHVALGTASGPTALTRY
ncbi:L,D-transpeptidase family protein [Streptomyces sp. Isolate_219]|uniref:L,D-transpeptidase family protein n=1 Tax=Streptomyces sp. Isolate_219 TaxID=2950110 RepID=UPI003967DD18